MKKNYPIFVFIFSFIFSVSLLSAQPEYNRELWLQKADQFKPELKVFKKTPVDIIEVLPSLGSFHGYQTRHLDNIENLKNYELGAGDKEQLLPCVELHAFLFYQKVSGNIRNILS